MIEEDIAILRHDVALIKATVNQLYSIIVDKSEKDRSDKAKAIEEGLANGKERPSDMVK